MKKLSRRQFISLAGAGATVAAAPGLATYSFGQQGVEHGDMREDSLWTKETPPIPPAPRLEDEVVADVAIIGGGYTGLACAYYCKKLRPDLSVTLLESHRLASGASSRNSGAVSASYRGIGETPLSRRGFERLMRFIEEEEVECDLRRGAVMELFPSEQAARKFQSGVTAGNWIPAEALSDSFHSSYYAGALETNEYVTIHPAKLAAGHVKAARRAGVELYEHSPVLRIEKGNPAHLSTPFGAVIAKRVFIATNAYTPRLGILRSIILPVHQFTFATRKLTSEEVGRYSLDRWPLRFERSILPVTNHLTPSGHFFIRIVLGYASFNSCRWADLAGAKDLARRMFVQRYPWVADIELTDGWHGVTGHTLKGRDVARPLQDGNILVSAAYNGLGVMPGHNNGYLAACRMAGYHDEDAGYFDERVRHYPFPGEFYRSLMFKPFMKLATPV
jgi:glycine/D-amino acid oxidase-like deaminating enzyme